MTGCPSLRSNGRHVLAGCFSAGRDCVYATLLSRLLSFCSSRNKGSEVGRSPETVKEQMYGTSCCSVSVVLFMKRLKPNQNLAMVG